MKPLIYFTDVHISKSTILSARKSCWETVKNALLWIAKRSEELDAAGIICGGDVTDKFNWTCEDTYTLWSIFSKFPKVVHTVVGNHDVSSGDLSLLPFSCLGSLFTASAYNGNKGLKWLKNTVTIDNFVISGVNWKDGILNSEFDFSNLHKKYSESKTPIDPSKIHIMVAHSSVCGSKDTDYATYYKDTILPDFLDFALFGDIHSGFGPANHGKVICGNPGAVYRKGIGEADNKPGIFIIYPDKKIIWEPIPIDPKEEAFYLEAHQEKKDRKVKNFKAAIAVAKTTRRIDPVEQARQVGNELKLSTQSIEEVVKRLQSK